MNALRRNNTSGSALYYLTRGNDNTVVFTNAMTDWAAIPRAWKIDKCYRADATYIYNTSYYFAFNYRYKTSSFFSLTHLWEFFFISALKTTANYQRQAAAAAAATASNRHSQHRTIRNIPKTVPLASGRRRATATVNVIILYINRVVVGLGRVVVGLGRCPVYVVVRTRSSRSAGRAPSRERRSIIRRDGGGMISKKRGTHWRFYLLLTRPPSGWRWWFLFLTTPRAR